METRLPECLAARPAILGKPQPYIIAHRGASDLAPENTLTAFQMAVDDGADVIETDLWLTRDRHLVCHHDATAERMTGDPRRIDTMTLDEVRALQVVSGDGTRAAGGRVPTLDELLAMAPSDVMLVLELKDRRLARPENAERLVAAVADRVAETCAIAISFDMGLLSAVRAIEPALPIGHVTLRNPLPTQPTEMLGPYWPLLYLNPFYVRMARRRGKWVCPLDPGLHKRLPRYLRMGVDAVLTNDPAATRREIERLQSSV